MAIQTNGVQDMSKKRLVSLIIISILSAAGLYTAVHLTELHYKKPKHQLSLINTVHFAERWFPREKVEKTASEGQGRQTADPYSDPDFNPYDNHIQVEKPKKEKEACDFSKTWSCSDVDDSPYSEIYGLGVGLYGIAGYSLMLLLALLNIVMHRKKSDFISFMIFCGAFIGIGFSIYLTCIEAFVLEKFCPYCVASAVAMLLIFIFTLVGFGFEPVGMFFRREIFPTSLLGAKKS